MIDSVLFIEENDAQNKDYALALDELNREDIHWPIHYTKFRNARPHRLTDVTRTALCSSDGRSLADLPGQTLAHTNVHTFDDGMAL
ncbi:hypothetical protein EVAR_69111_1 [Eumeta japonica]|uniref:Uncharacterized protein n=1 Tax=Eumeta variegata TaxID=151549 RepID=A0A4C1SN45_EUMVA|nr:hypothetical protein EVAR_69111_1 [Eumeta japonica]